MFNTILVLFILVKAEYFYEGMWENDQKNGLGKEKIVFRESISEPIEYEGEFKNNMRDG